MTTSDAFDEALRAALLKVFPNPTRETVTPHEVAQLVKAATPVAPRLRGEGAVTLYIPRCDWPRVHNTIRARNTPVETHRNSPPGFIALSTTPAHARGLMRDHPTVKVNS